MRARGLVAHEGPRPLMTDPASVRISSAKAGQLANKALVDQAGCTIETTFWPNNRTL